MDYASWTDKVVAIFPFKDSFTAFPIASVLFNIALASCLSLITSTDGNYQSLLIQGSNMSSLVSGASISIVTLTFSLTVLSVQIASQSYSPRLLEEFLKDPVSKIVVAMNLGAYAYCYTLEFFLEPPTSAQDVVGKTKVPYVAIYMLSAHMLLVILSLVNFIHLFINGFRLESILDRAATSSVRASRMLATAHGTTMDTSSPSSSSSSGSDLPEVPRRAFKVLADESGYISMFRLDRLVPLAQSMDVCVRYRYQIGEYVNRATVLCYIWDAKTVEQDDNEKTMEQRVLKYISLLDDQNDEDSLKKDKTREQRVEQKLGIFASRGVVITRQRTADYDLSLGIQQLSDVAVRALSPGVNDPQTAIQSMDVLTRVLGTLAVSPFGTPKAFDSDGILRACAPQRSFSYLLSMLDGIRLYGKDDVSVCRRGIRMFGELAVIMARSGQVDRVPEALAHLDQWMSVSRKTFEEGTPERNALEELHEHLLQDVAECESVLIRNGDEVKDLQEFEMTHYDEGESSQRLPSRDGPSRENTLMEFLNQALNMKK